MGDKTISEIIAGKYIAHSENHGKVVYKREDKSKGLEIFIYFWDDRDGDGLCGWWFGPSVGGEQVWAYHPSRTAAPPPASEWNVPHDGAIDPSFSVKAAKKGDKTKAKEKKSASDAPEPPKTSDSGAHSHFVNAYNKRREERLAAEAKETSSNSNGEKPTEEEPVAAVP